MKITIFALGGNQLAPVSDKVQGIKQQFRTTYETAKILSDYIRANPGMKYIITHGNGPQVGNRVLSGQNVGEKGYGVPLDVAVASTQGEIAYMIQQQFKKAFGEKHINEHLVGIITRVLVNKDDPAFSAPTKYIGGCYTKEELKKKYGECTELNDLKKPEIHVPGKIYRIYNKHYRKVVASPKPVDIVDFSAIILAIRQGMIPVCLGGGGIPVTGEAGVEAVVDKDLATALLAIKLKKEFHAEIDLFILTNVDAAYLNFEERNEKKIKELTLDAARELLKKNEFPNGSMGTKIEASINAVEAGVDRVIITDPKHLREAAEGKAGTIIKIK